MRGALKMIAGLALALASAAPQIAQAQASASAFTQGFRYDAARRLTGKISPDPDGDTGSIKYAAVRGTYDTGGRLAKVETGELSAWQSEAVAPSNWGNAPSEPASFTVFRTVEYSYDTF